MAETPAAEIKRKIQAVTDLIETSQEKLRQGQQVDLRSLESMAADLYQTVARQPATNAQMGPTALIDSFTAILSGLDRLEAEVRAQQARRAGNAVPKSTRKG